MKRVSCEILNKEISSLNELTEKQIKEFESIKTELKKVFRVSNLNNHNNLVYDENKVYCVLNDNITIAVRSKGLLGFELLKEFINTENNIKFPNLDYSLKNDEKDLNIECNYSTYYLFDVINIFNKFKLLDSERVKIKVKSDYPITILNKHLTFVISPRGEDND